MLRHRTRRERILQAASFNRWPLVDLVEQHVAEAVHLRDVRSRLVRAPHVRLTPLTRSDERLAAHLDAVSLSGFCGAKCSNQTLERVRTGPIFLATVLAIEARDESRLGQLLDLVIAVPASRPGLLSAFGWVSPARLQGITASWLTSLDKRRREVALLTCALHAVDPGPLLMEALAAKSAGLRVAAMRVAVACARVDAVDAALNAMSDDHQAACMAGACTALLLGDRRRSVDTLEHWASAEGGEVKVRSQAALMVLNVLSRERAHPLLASLSKEPALVRGLIQGIASAGDPYYLTWLITLMDDPRYFQLAGEAFSFVTGVDLTAEGLERRPPEALAGDDGIDGDDGLPQPDLSNVSAWWQANSHRFPAGTRHFMGQPVTQRLCIDILRTGYQRQRIAAARYLSLLNPGTPLFNTCAPAWRQHRLLAKMVA